MSHEEIKKLIMNCDQEKLNESAIESLLKYLPSAEQVCDTPTLTCGEFHLAFGGMSWVSFWGMSWVSFGECPGCLFGECPGCLLGNVLGVFWGISWVSWGNLLGVFWGISWVSWGESPCLVLPFWGISSWLFIIQIVIVVAFFNAPNWYVKNACSNLFLFFYAGHNGNLI